MAIEVRIPTILRSYTGNAKAVQGSGDTIADLLALYKELDANDEDPVVIYHSHTATEAYPSRTDVSFAGEPGAHYLLVSTRHPELTEVRSFRIVDGAVTEEPVEVVNASVDQHAVQSYLFGQSPTTVDYECRAGS